MDTPVVRPGDTAIFVCPEGTSQDQRDALTRALEQWLPGVKVRIVYIGGSGVTLSLVAVYLK
jgi:hypothetical protein